MQSWFPKVWGQLQIDIFIRNSDVSLSGTLPDSADWIQDSIGNNRIIYSHHRPTGVLLFSTYFRCGWFGGGHFRIYKWIHGGWNETVYAANFGWNTNTTVNANSTGSGQYRICSETAFQFVTISWRIYCGQTDCTKGKHLTVYDGFRSSINTLPGTLITPSLCNSQRVGTLGTP
ncbi:hypothetical protein [Parasphaerochaeta coccoides]|uniref:Uncharacterized protein n=1 Tax=Parasphaerochaeta coccoides (strain ATCC BAA-1237 / DSM 17374 / SPN1) TaxID=760011 RepID=F4GL23_PARC1|nr:hypothetical protein [Parasphaerochaeta coccoides]AEC02363.1 hypothetical protein Spico_1147 [Parasphaerochaeta coccoides DSM 17374]